MIKSMTGYGGVKGVCDSLSIRVELKSVNNRYLDCAVRMPRNLLFAEETVKNAVQNHISRGKVDVFLTVDAAASDDVTVRVNEALARSYVDALGALADTFSVENDLTALNLSRMPDVLSLEKRDTDAEVFTEGLALLVEQALGEFDAMRAREGAKLAQDISAHLDAVEDYVAMVERRSPDSVTQYRQKLYNKMCEVLQKPGVDEQRILLEAAIFADKVAVDEETVRLRSHVAQMRDMLSGDSPIGRKMDFLVQEFNREANTIGSKCTDSAITKIVVELKSEIEKIREQIQNIE